MTTRTEKASLDRRAFLKGAGVGTVGAAAAVAGTVVGAAPAKAEAKPAEGYRETAHVKTFYATARF